MTSTRLEKVLQIVKGAQKSGPKKGGRVRGPEKWEGEGALADPKKVSI